MSPNASNTTSRRTSSDVRRSLFASRSNWMARPAPNSSENSANAFNSTASVRIVSTALSIDDAGGLGKRNCSKIETRNIGHDVDRDDAEQCQAPQHVDGVDPLGGTCRPGRCGAIGHCNLVPVERRNEIRAPLYDSRISSSRRPSVLSIFFTALEAAISPWLA